jgi:hypothetical protein
MDSSCSADRHHHGEGLDVQLSQSSRNAFAPLAAPSEALIIPTVHIRFFPLALATPSKTHRGSKSVNNYYPPRFVRRNSRTAFN